MCLKMSYILSHSPSEQVALVQDTLQAWAHGESDLIFLTSDGKKISTSRTIISMFSDMFRSFLSIHSVGKPVVSVPISFRCLNAIISLLTRGLAELVDNQDIIAAASVLNIPLANVVKGKAELPSKQNIQNNDSINVVYPHTSIFDEGSPNDEIKSEDKLA
jgi:hypothetical protein